MMARSKLSRMRGESDVYIPSDGGSRSGFVVDDKAVAKLLDTPQARAHLQDVLDQAVFHVRAASPGPEDAAKYPYATGDFRGSLSGTVRVVLDGKIAKGHGRQTTGQAQRRLVGFLTSSDPVWHLLEYGGYHNASPPRPFYSGLTRAGLQYERTARGGA